jgi:cytochrome c5
MKSICIIVAGLLLSMGAVCVTMSAADPTSGKAALATSAPDSADLRKIHDEGERRFHANCGRCHATPHKFPRPMMATIVRHMRVRACITDQDLYYILRYLSE